MQRLQSKSRALISTLLIVLLSTAGLSATSSPAKAISIPPLTDQNRIYTIGDTVDLDLSCQPDFVGENGGNSATQEFGQIPPATTIDGIVTKVRGKNVTTRMLKVTASIRAGTCSVTLSSVAKDEYLAMSKPVKIKASKIGR